MIKPYLLALLASSIALAFTLDADRSDQTLTVFETAPLLKTSIWEQQQSAPLDAELNLHIRLREESAEELEQLVFNIATPDHSQYGKFLTRDELLQLRRPSQQAIDNVASWLREHGIPSHTNLPSGQIDFKVSVQQASRLLNTKFHLYVSKENNQTLIRAKEYSLPLHLHQYIKTILPIVRLPQIRAHASNVVKIVNSGQISPSLAYDPNTCNETITPACLQGLYQLNNFTAPLHQGTSLGISAFLFQTLRENDLHDYIAAAAPGVPQPFPQIITTDGSIPLNASSAAIKNTIEASLDVQIAAALAPGIPIKFFSTSGLAPKMIPDVDQPDPALAQNEPFLAHMEYLVQLPDDELPSVLSISYGESEQSVPLKYAVDVCSLISRLAIRGVSTIVSSGDSGVGSGCQRNDGTDAPYFEPTFPASCVYVTTVGATQGVEPERAASFSSGGFSNYFAANHHQDLAVGTFLAQNGNKNKGLFKPEGRAFPDVSTQGVNVIIRDHGFNQAVSGTSGSAPIFAAMIANLNALRRSQGKPNLGWLNMWLYQNATSAFTDVTVGSSTGCTGRSVFSGHPGKEIKGATWDAVPGWDPVTGLGTPIWPKLVEISSATPGGGKVPSQYDPDSPDFGKKPPNVKPSGQAFKG